ncbi:MAG: HAMP domain-containing protein [Elusimicrobia bacterium]|nr:HAMP domain-containing protein [Elusimicrobiota bacterium]
MRIRLFPKLVAVMLAVSVVPIALLGYRLISIGQLGATTARLELHIGMADAIAREFETYMVGVNDRAAFVMGAISKMDWENKQTLLTSFMDANGDINEISMISNSGKELVKVFNPSVKADLSFRDYIKDRKFLGARDEKTRTLEFQTVNGKNNAVLYYPFGRNFVFKLAVGLDKFLSTLNLKKIGDTGYSLIVDKNGEPIAYTRDIGRGELGGVKKWPIVEEALKALSAGASESFYFGGVEQIGAYAPIPAIAGAAIIKQSKEEAYRSAAFMRRDAVKIMLLFVAVVFAAAFFLSRQLSRPIIEITRVAEKVAEGDFSRTVDVRSRDELKDLGETFNKMVRQLKTYSDMQVDRIIREQKNTEAILFSTEDGFVMIDGSGCVQLANRKARSVLGLAPEAAIEGKDLLELIGEPGMRNIVAEVLSSRKEDFFRDIEVALEHSKRFFKCFSAPIIAPEQDVRLGTLVAFYDITLAKELERIKDEFLHSITHDLRNPMGAIKGFVEFMIKEVPGPVNEAQKKMLVSIDRAAFRLLGMINNILDIAKMEAGKMEIKLAPVNAAEAAKRVVELLESLGQRKRIKFVLDAPVPVTLEADAGLIERMFTNLIGNAVKFAPENGVITVGIGEDGENLIAFVADNGDGIPLEYMNKVFEKFEQVKGQKAGGTGLGLTICKHIAAAHLGRIWAESEPGKGAKFIFTVPKKLKKDEAGKLFVAV